MVVGGIGLLKTERYVHGGVQARLSFFSLLYGMPANISRKPATGGMASQHLRTFEWTFLNQLI